MKLARSGAALAVACFLGCSSGAGRSGMPVASSAAAASTTAAVTSSGTAPGPSSAPASVAAPTYGTRHCWPIVLVHGSPGFSKLGPVDYFFDIPRLLAADGFEVFAPSLQGSDIPSRAKSLADQIQARYPDPRVRVNLVAHSAGGLDARYAISTLGLAAKVASLTTIATPHRGCAVNDLSLQLFPNLPSWLDTVVSLIGFDRSKEFTTTYVNGTFDPANPDDARVAYFSWAGSVPLKDVDPLFAISWTVLTATEGANDGVVSVASAKWGDFRGTVPADHLDEIGQPIGLGGFDHRRFFEDWANELERRGFGP